MLNMQNICCLNFILLMNCIVCRTFDNIHLSDFGDSETVPDAQEIIRRRNIAENYLKKNNNAEKDWIETYHTSFSGKADFTSKKTVQGSSSEDGHQVRGTFPLQNEALSPLKTLDNSDHLYKDLFTGNNLGVGSKDEIVSAKTSSDKIHEEFYKSDKAGIENQDSPRSRNNGILHLLSPFNDMISKKCVKTYYKSGSKPSNLRKFHCNCDTLKDNNIRNIKNDNLRLTEFKNFSTDPDKIIQISLKNSEFTSIKYFIHGKTLTQTEFNKLQKYLSSLSFLQKSKNSVYSVNRMNIIDSIGEITPLLIQDKFNKINQQQLCKFSNIDSDINVETCSYEKNLTKKSAPDFKKRSGVKEEYREKNAQKRFNDLSLTEYEKNILPNSLEKSDYFSHESEVLRRKKLMNSFVITLNNNQENWIETYHLNDVKSKTHSENNLNRMTEKPDGFCKIHSQERLYIIRWINKLQNKLKDSHINYHSLSISVSIDVYKILGKLSQDFDIVIFDELINSMISNATLHVYANAVYLGYENIFNAIYLLFEPKTYIFIVLAFCLFSLCSFFSNTQLNSNFILDRIILHVVKHFKWILFFTVLGFSFYLTGYKMYQKKIAEKHKIMSSVVPSYCESILNEKSGVFAHIEEWLRLWQHDENCRKYYEAVMVDPSSEITFFSISTDLLSDAIFQMLQPFARNMNIFFKDLTHGLSYYHQIFIVIATLFTLIIILYFCLSFFAFRHKYKVNFPFHLGSVEPTEFCKGSRVEELEEKEPSLKAFSSCCYAPQINCLDEIKSKKWHDHVDLKEKFLIDKVEAIKPCILKIPRTRCNSI